MSGQPLLFFDSGIGGLTILREARILIPDFQFIYVADDDAFPYGIWEENTLKRRILKIFDNLLKLYKPALCIIACNTVSTLMITDLRQKFPNIPFIGTVPAIKTASEKTKSGLLSVLATPGTIRRAYTRELIDSFADQCYVNLVGSEILAGFAENYVRGYPIDEAKLQHEIRPCFIQKNGKYTDTIVLACTHYPFLIDLFHKYALWPVEWIDSAKAVAQYARSVLLKRTIQNKRMIKQKDFALFTSRNNDLSIRVFLKKFGLDIMKIIDFKI